MISLRALILITPPNFFASINAGTFYSHAALGMATLIKSSYPSSVGHVDLYTSLGKMAVLCIAVLFFGECV